MRRTIACSLAVSSLLAVFSMPAAAQTLELRGRLVDRRGQPESGTCLLRFKLFEGKTRGAEAAWSEALYVSVRDGDFEAVLGRGKPIPARLLAASYHLAIEPPASMGWQAVGMAMPAPAPRAAAEQPLPLPAAAALPPQPPPAVAPQVPAAAQGGGTPTQPKAPEGSRIYEVKAGDTLQSVAAKLLGDPARWVELYDLNSDRTQRGGDLTVGQRLLLPEMGD